MTITSSNTVIEYNQQHKNSANRPDRCRWDIQFSVKPFTAILWIFWKRPQCIFEF